MSSCPCFVLTAHCVQHCGFDFRFLFFYPDPPTTLPPPTTTTITTTTILPIITGMVRSLPLKIVLNVYCLSSLYKSEPNCSLEVLGINGFLIWEKLQKPLDVCVLKVGS